MKIVYALQKAPEGYSKSIFLAGPTPRNKDVSSWRPEAIHILKQLGYDGVVFVPETSDGNWKRSYDSQIEWEETYLHYADVIVFWVPREFPNMPALTTNVEWGMWHDSGKIVFGAPREAVSVSYLEYYASKAQCSRNYELRQTLVNALLLIGAGSYRLRGETAIPLSLWNTASFQLWYSALKTAGNILEGGRVEWTFRVGPKRDIILFWAFRAKIWVAGEGRFKENEVVIGRPDIASVVMYHRPHAGCELSAIKVVLVREFRSSVSNLSGFVTELPGGSSLRPGQDIKTMMIGECKEEAGVTIDPQRLIIVSQRRQVSATVSTHTAMVGFLNLSMQEMSQIEALIGSVHGNEQETECTYVEVKTVADILKDDNVDWATLGMILSVLQ